MGNYDQIKNILLNFDIDIIGFTETFLTKNVLTSELIILEFNILRKDRAPGTGVFLYVKHGVNFVRRFDLEQENIESIFIKIFQPNSKSFIIGVVYRPPDSSKDLCNMFTELLTQCLQKISLEQKE